MLASEAKIGQRVLICRAALYRNKMFYTLEHLRDRNINSGTIIRIYEYDNIYVHLEDESEGTLRTFQFSLDELVVDE